MGRRVHSAIGYGVLLTKDEINKHTDDEAYDKLKEFVESKVKRAVETKKSLHDKFKKNETKITDEEGDRIDDLLEMLDFDAVFDENMDVKVECAIIDYMVNHIQYPHNNEIGTFSFMGYLELMRYDDTLDWEMLTVLGINQATMENSEFEMTDVKYSPNVKRRLINEGFLIDESVMEGVTVEVPWFKLIDVHDTYTLVKDGNKTREKGYLPHRSMFDFYKGLDADLLKKFKAEKKKIFMSKEECRDYLQDFFKRHNKHEYPQHNNALLNWHAWYYDKGYEIVKLLYPDIPFERVHKYLLFWIS